MSSFNTSKKMATFTPTLILTCCLSVFPSRHHHHHHHQIHSFFNHQTHQPPAPSGCLHGNATSRTSPLSPFVTSRSYIVVCISPCRIRIFRPASWPPTWRCCRSWRRWRQAVKTGTTSGCRGRRTCCQRYSP